MRNQTRKSPKYLEANPNLRAIACYHIRHIKHEFFIDEDIAAMTMAARLAYIGLWTVADKNGNFQWKPRTLKTEVLPFDDGVNFEDILNELRTNRFIEQYEVDGVLFGHIRTWTKHQAINPKETASRFAHPTPLAHANTCQQVPAGADTCRDMSQPEHKHEHEGLAVVLTVGERERKTSNHPTIPKSETGGQDGGRGVSFSGTSTPPTREAPPMDDGVPVPLTVEVMLDTIRKSHKVEWDALDDDSQELVPSIPPSNARDKLFKVLQTLKYPVMMYKTRNEDDDSSLNHVGNAYGSWFRTRYLKSFQTAKDARANQSEENWRKFGEKRIPQPIHSPLAVFADECEPLLEMYEFERESEFNQYKQFRAQVVC